VRSVSKEFRAVLVVALIGAAVSVGVGLGSNVSLGDEVYHFSMAKRWVESGHRPIDEPQMFANPQGKVKYMAMPLWPGGLALLWSVTGIRQDVAQVYQGLWYVLLVLATYDLGCQVYGRRAGFWAGVLAATMPFAVAFTTMLYVDVPAMAISTFAIGCLMRRWFLRAGVVLGVAFWTKQNAYLLVPGVVAGVVLLARGGLVRRLAWAAACIGLASALHAPELLWRYQHLGTVTNRQATPPSVRADSEQVRLEAHGEPVSPAFVHPSDIVRKPQMLVRYLGIPLLAGLVWAVVGAAAALGRSDRRRGGQGGNPQGSWVLALIILLYIPEFFYLFRGFLGVRYLAPILPMACVLAAGAMASVRHPAARAVLAVAVLAMGAGQVAVGEAFVYSQRRLSPDMLAAYRWVAANTPSDAGVLCQNAVLTPMTGRRAIWRTPVSLPGIGFLLWQAREDEARRMLRRYGVDYVFVERLRIYDDSHERRLPDWPRSFVDKLETWPSMERVFRNKEAAIWRVSPTPASTSPASSATSAPQRPGESEQILDACAPGGVESPHQPGVGARMP
jgi:4-amino-4-deoxy-L-arabinose transferase-like glycosyltransferase